MGEVSLSSLTLRWPVGQIFSSGQGSHLGSAKVQRVWAWSLTRE